MATDQLTDKEIFNFARRLELADAVSEYLEQVCGEDPDRKQRILKLVEADMGDSFLEKRPVPLPETVESRASTRKEGQKIGNYKLLHLLGEGGMGSVYLAEQHTPVKRRVAVKIIKQGMNSDQFIARFEAERQALAMMDHPNIAKVLDAGCTENERPYFVMELVKGVPINEFCDDNRLTTEERLQLFVQVCKAVQHAHQKGIIHRDLKPSNVMVAMYDDQPVPKVIDFGVAKATHQPLTEQTLYTVPGQIVGTWEYMSPEQAILNQLDVDTRTDVYSLGVILYQLLTGETPLDLKSLEPGAWEERLRRIREEEPARPSIKISGLGQAAAPMAAYRRTEESSLFQSISGDLDWIVMKALEKDRSKRYETANGFAAEVTRYLNDEPLSFRPPSKWERFSRMYRRNKAAVTTALLTICALALGLIIALGQYKVASERASRLQESEASLSGKNEELSRILSLLQDALFDFGMLEAFSGNDNNAMDSATQLRTAGDDERARLLELCAQYSAGYISETDAQGLCEQARNAVKLYPDNIALKAFMAISYDAVGEIDKHVDATSRIVAAKPRTVEDRLLLAKALQVDPLVGLRYIDEAIAIRRPPYAILLRGRIAANYIMQSGDLTRVDDAFADINASQRLLDLSKNDDARVNAFASWLAIAAAAETKGNSSLKRKALDEAKSLGALVQALGRPVVWDNFYLANLSYQTGQTNAALEYHHKSALQNTSRGYYSSAYYALAYELDRSPDPLTSEYRDPFHQFAKAIFNWRDGKVESIEQIALSMLNDSNTVWSRFMAMNLLALASSDLREDTARMCVEDRPLSGMTSGEQWVEEELMAYHAGSESSRLEILHSSDNSDYPVMCRMLAQLTFGLESLGRYSRLLREDDLAIAVNCFEDCAKNEIIYFPLHKWGRALAVQTRQQLDALRPLVDDVREDGNQSIHDDDALRIMGETLEIVE